MPPFRSVKLRKRRASCSACGTEGQKLGKIEDIDYVQFCGGEIPDYVRLGLEPGTPENRITANVGTMRASFVQKIAVLMDSRNSGTSSNTSLSPLGSLT